MMWRYALAWVPMVAIAIGNGILREFTYGKRVSERTAHQISSFTALVLFGIYVFVLTRVWKLESFGQAVGIGALWVGLTVAFEFGFGHWVAGHSWKKLLHDYNLFAGRLWILIPLWLLLAPALFSAL